MLPFTNKGAEYSPPRIHECCLQLRQVVLYVRRQRLDRGSQVSIYSCRVDSQEGVIGIYSCIRVLFVDGVDSVESVGNLGGHPRIRGLNTALHEYTSMPLWVIPQHGAHFYKKNVVAKRVGFTRCLPSRSRLG
jgi:hypothetical protein